MWWYCYIVTVCLNFQAVKSSDDTFIEVQDLYWFPKTNETLATKWTDNIKLLTYTEFDLPYKMIHGNIRQPKQKYTGQAQPNNGQWHNKQLEQKC